MSSPTALLLHQPIILFSPCSPSYFSSRWKLKSVKPFSFLQSPTSNPVSSPGFGSVSRKAGRCTMTRSSTEAFGHRDRDGDGDGDEDGVFEQEAFISGSGAGFMVEATLNDLSRWIIVAVFGAITVCRHDLVAVWFAGGAVLNNFISLVLKRILNQERPDANLRSDPGMPSSHAQNIFYISTFAVISIFELLGANRYTILASGVTLSFASYFTWLRVSQQLHTVSQITVGAVLGTIMGISWYWSWHAIAMQAFESMPWVQVLVFLGAAAACINFIAQVFHHWFKNES